LRCIFILNMSLDFKTCSGMATQPVTQQATPWQASRVARKPPRRSQRTAEHAAQSLRRHLNGHAGRHPMTDLSCSTHAQRAACHAAQSLRRHLSGHAGRHPMTGLSCSTHAQRAACHAAQSLRRHLGGHAGSPREGRVSWSTQHRAGVHSTDSSCYDTSVAGALQSNTCGGGVVKARLIDPLQPGARKEIGSISWDATTSFLEASTSFLGMPLHHFWRLLPLRVAGSSIVIVVPLAAGIKLLRPHASRWRDGMSAHLGLLVRTAVA
jgi:hypothetical protein